MSQKTKAEIIQETYEAYLDPNNRGAEMLDEGTEIERAVCSYLTADGKMCAVGRCMREDVNRHKFSGSVAALVATDPVAFEEALKEEYRGHEPAFWEALQGFHDTDKNFKLDGYTEDGLEHLESIKQTWIK